MRFYLRDNFLRSWLGALSVAVSSMNFRPVADLVREADQGLETAEGHGLERLVAALYEERSRKEIGDFPLSRMIEGYWDRSGWSIEKLAITPRHDERSREACRARGYLPEDLTDLTAAL